MHLNTFRRAVGHTPGRPPGRHALQANGQTPVRPSGRHAWTTGALLVSSVVLMTWAGSSLVDAPPADSSVDQGRETGRETDREAAQQERRGPTLTPEDRRPLRAARRENTLIEPPLAVSSTPLHAGGATVQAPQDVAEPTRITIPRLEIDQDLTELDVIGSTLQVPDDYDDIGWWGGGPVPGRRGSAVVVGHVDSPTGPAVFYGLSGVAPGYQVEVGLEDGSRAVFAVTDVEVYDKNSFPSAEVYQASGRPGLYLVTCGGTFDTETQQYSSNVVVSTRLLKRIPAGDARSEAEAEADDRPSPGPGPTSGSRRT